jgi:hypothetical protein
MIPSLGTKAAIFCDVLRHCPTRAEFESAMSLDNGLLTAGCMSGVFSPDGTQLAK